MTIFQVFVNKILAVAFSCTSIKIFRGFSLLYAWQRYKCSCSNWSIEVLDQLQSIKLGL